VPDAELVRDSSGDGLSDWLSRQGWRVAFLATDHLSPNDFTGTPSRGERGSVVAQLVVCEPRPYAEATADCRIVPMADVAGIDAPPIGTVAEDVVTREYVRSEVDSSVDNLYAYLHGERADLALELDLQPIVDGFATEYEQWVLNASVAELEPDGHRTGVQRGTRRHERPPRIEE
jgi:hypothetical protein